MAIYISYYMYVYSYIPLGGLMVGIAMYAVMQMYVNMQLTC